MTDPPHSRAWYARLARELGGYRHPWSRVLDGPDPELTFDALLMEHLRPDTRVLEAGCGHGPDAARFGSECMRWAAYDWVPEMLRLARENAPAAEFHLWNGKGEVPTDLRGPFDLIVSRQGPTSVIDLLSRVAAPNARLLYMWPIHLVPRPAPERLAAVGWEVLSEWKVSVQAWQPTFADWQARCEFMGFDTHMDEAAQRLAWNTHARARGMRYEERRYVVLAGASTSSP